MFFNHIVQDDFKQDAYAVEAICDALACSLKKRFSGLEDAWIVSDNAPNYTNDMVPSTLPIIFDQCGLRLRGSLHPETAQGKDLADSHFAIAMRLIYIYIYIYIYI